MRKIIRPCKVVKIQKSHSITLDMVLSPTTKNPRAQLMPRMGTSTKEAWSRVLEDMGYLGHGVQLLHAGVKFVHLDWPIWMLISMETSGQPVR